MTRLTLVLMAMLVAILLLGLSGLTPHHELSATAALFIGAVMLAELLARGGVRPRRRWE